MATAQAGGATPQAGAGAVATAPRRRRLTGIGELV